MLKVEHDVQLDQYTTFRIGGPAEHLVRIKNLEDLNEAADYVKKSGLPFFILGGGSNILIDDKGIRGVVLKIETKGVRFEEVGENKVRVTAEAGENWDDVVGQTVERGLSGIEHLSLIPGNVGAAPVQNIGAYGKELKDVCESIDAFNIDTKEEKTFTAKENEFKYRGSFWKSEEGKKYVVTRVRMILEKTEHSTAEYKDVKEYFEKNNKAVTPANVREAVIFIRKNKLPDVNLLGTAGSFFKNPVISPEKYAELQAKYNDIPKFDMANGQVKIPAAWVLDRVCGLKGLKMGNVGLYEKQPLAVVNFSDANSNDVEKFANEVSNKFFAATGINLEWEVEKVN